MTSSSTDIAIDCCHCEDKPFECLIAVARRERVNLRKLAHHEGCETHCGWCIAQLRRALRTGGSVFHELLPKEPLDNHPKGS